MRYKGIYSFLFAAVFLGITVPVSADFSKPAKNLSHNGMSWSTARDIAVIPGTNKVFALWTDLDSDLERPLVRFSKSIDGGATWSPGLSLNCNDPWWWDNPNYWGMCGAAMAVDDPYVHVVMSFNKTLSMDYEISYRRSIDLGETWEPWVRLTSSSAPSMYPDVAAGGGYVHIVYETEWPGNWEIMYKRIANNGAGPVDQTRRLSFSTGTSRSPALALSNDGLVVNIVYHDNTSGTYQIPYKRLPASGAGAMETRFLTFGGHDKTFPSIATSAGADGQYVFVVHTDYVDSGQGHPGVLFKRLNKYGAPGGEFLTRRLTSPQSNAYPSSIVCDGSTKAVYAAYVAWPTGLDDVYYKKLDDYGAGSLIGGRISYGEGTSIGAYMAAADGWDYVIWSDDTGLSGIPDIFFKRGN